MIDKERKKEESGICETRREKRRKGGVERQGEKKGGRGELIDKERKKEEGGS